MQANVSASAGESNGCWKKLNVFLTAVVPKLVPSRQASRWTRHQAADSPVWAARNHWKAMKPTGASATAISDHQSRRR
jgi:hypothetical protein